MSSTELKIPLNKEAYHWRRIYAHRLNALDRGIMEQIKSRGRCYERCVPCDGIPLFAPLWTSWSAFDLHSWRQNSSRAYLNDLVKELFLFTYARRSNTASKKSLCTYRCASTRDASIVQQFWRGVVVVLLLPTRATTTPMFVVIYILRRRTRVPGIILIYYY